MEKILKLILIICVLILLVIVTFDLYEVDQKSLNIIFIIGLLNLYSKGSEE